ncbi:MAG: hypothetical protein DMG38_24645 [Acidobacteria bacterium]|nr:MAG: hypothetical protein DMG38_24645 [Acidobacteriota bacterium]
MGHVLEPLLHDLAERFCFLEEELGKMVVPPKAEASRRQIHQNCNKGQEARGRGFERSRCLEARVR